MKKLQKDSLYQVLWSELFQSQPTKGQRTQVAIAEAAIRLYAKQGVQATTYDHIAKEAEVSRPLVIKYFASYEDLFSFVVNYLRAKVQKIVVEAVSHATSPMGQFTAYIDSTFDVIQDYPQESKVWLYFYYSCSIEKKYRRLNTALVDMGTERIRAMLDAGKKTGVFSFSDSAITAREIQIQITGAVLSILSEERRKEILDIQTMTRGVCLRLAGAKS